MAEILADKDMCVCVSRVALPQFVVTCGFEEVLEPESRGLEPKGTGWLTPEPSTRQDALPARDFGKTGLKDYWNRLASTLLDANADCASAYDMQAFSFPLCPPDRIGGALKSSGLRERQVSWLAGPWF